MKTGQPYLPKARRDGLTIRTIGDEVLVFDVTTDTAHALNRPAAFVWQHADGTRTVETIAREMTHALGAQADAQVVGYALDQLKRRNLLEIQDSSPTYTAGLTRRQFIGRAAAGAALLAVVTSIAAPSPAHAQSACLGEGVSCVATPLLCCPDLGCCVGAGPTCESFC